MFRIHGIERRERSGGDVRSDVAVAPSSSRPVGEIPGSIYLLSVPLDGWVNSSSLRAKPVSPLTMTFRMHLG